MSGSLPLPRAAFISSRTDELRLEREAVSAAIEACGLTVFAFDSALNKLSDAALIEDERGTKQHERRVSGKRNLRDQIDSLVDGSDILIGVYMRTAGHQEYSAGWLTWVEYELYRFLLRQLELKGHGLKQASPNMAEFYPWKPLSDRERTRLNDLVRDSSKIAELRSLLHRAAINEPDPEVTRLSAVLRSRTLLFFKRPQEDNPQLSYDLQEFLLPLRPHLREIRTTVRESRDNIGDFHYFPAHAQLFEAVFDQLARNRASQNPAEPDEGILISVRRSKAPNPPSILYPILRDVFQQGLSVNQLFVGHGRDGDQASGLQCFCTPRSLTADLQRIRSSLAEAFDEHLAQAPELQGSVEVLERLDYQKTETPNPAADHVYRICVVDSPGSLWAVCTLIASYGGSISFLTHDDLEGVTRSGPLLTGYNQGVEFVVAFEIRQNAPAQSSRICSIDAHIPTFEYQLKSLHAVVWIQRLNQAEYAQPSPVSMV